MKMNRPTGMTLYFLIILLLFSRSLVLSQAAGRSSDASGLISVFIDFPDWYMDMDYIRTEIPYVNYMRDRADADVHILTTTQRTGSDGCEYTINFIGLGAFAGQENTLTYTSQQTDTEDMIRGELVRHFKIGLMQYVSHSSAIDRINIHYRDTGPGESGATPVNDPWNYWTFRTSLRGHFSGEKSYKNNSLSASISADRVTEDWKLSFYLSMSNTRTIYDYGEGLSYNDQRRSDYFRGSIVRSLTPRWSLAAISGASRSTYSNLDLTAYWRPGIEFNVYPYSEATRRQFTFQYMIGVDYYDYHELTIYYKMKECRLSENLQISYQIKQPWGSINASLYGSHYFHDMEKFHVSLINSLELRLVKGLSLDIFGYITFVRDQLSLPASGASLEEILLRRRELETSYDYYLSIGLSYTFGSIYNNVVNPRFGG
ncbi:hypothetical protein JXO52_10990 [bacterium]|nr:hypothetical protein [bacterium]